MALPPSAKWTTRGFSLHTPDGSHISLKGPRKSVERSLRDYLPVWYDVAVNGKSPCPDLATQIATEAAKLGIPLPVGTA